MLFSLYGLVQLAQDENEANDQIQKTNQVLLCDNFNSFSNAYSVAGIFESDEVEDFGNALQENLTQFAKEYKEKEKMYRIINNRGTGKTKKLMLLAKDNGALFICANPHAMEQKALAYGITGLNFLSYDNAPCYYEEGKILNVVIDDIEAFAKWFIGNDKLIGYTLTNED